MKKMNLRRILAILALILIAGLYAVTIICALIDSPFAKSCLMASLFCTVVVPVIIYAFLLFDRVMRQRREQMTDAAPSSADDISADEKRPK